MTRSCLSILLLLALVAATAHPITAEEEAERVLVVNLPGIQTVDGTVEVAGPISQTKLFSLTQEVVSPVGPEQTTDMVLAGTLQSAGFGTAVLSLAGQIRAAFYQPGRVGAILVPDVQPAQSAFLEEGQLLFPLRVEADAATEGGIYFSSDQPLFRLGFDRYRVYFYNTTDRPATVSLFAYFGN
ncbi:MAG: hypothetical protein GY769_17020 [bacterium]|nr:hypothetical protein [bacterium]